VLAGRGEGLEERLVAIEATLSPDVPLLVQCADVTLTELATRVAHPTRLIGFDGLFFTQGTLATLIPGPNLPDSTRRSAEAVVSSLGRHPLWITDSPGLILPRVIGMLINEAVFAAHEGVADAETIDLAMQLGVSYPKGLIAWGEELGFQRVLAVLEHLQQEYGETRYRPCVLLRRWARCEQIEDR
jgi:3-hydroxybutyryl-CoA dehydrogenase